MNFNPMMNPMSTANTMSPMNFSMEQFEKAMIIKNRIKFPIFAEIQKIALAKCNPYKEIAVWDIR